MVNIRCFGNLQARARTNLFHLVDLLAASLASEFGQEKLGGVAGFSG